MTRKETPAERRQKTQRLLGEEELPTQFCCEDETPGAEETLEFWKGINNKEVSAGWMEDRSIREVRYETRKRTERGRQCRLVAFTETEFDEVLRCTAPWKACGVDSVYSFPIKKCPPIGKAVYQLVKMWNGESKTDGTMRTTGCWKAGRS